MSIKESQANNYSVTLSWLDTGNYGRPADEPFSYDYRAYSPTIGAFHLFQLPAHFGLCGIDVADHTNIGTGPMVLHAQGQIPQHNTCGSGISRIYACRLNSISPQSICKPNISHLAPIPTQLTLTSSGSTSQAQLSIRKVLT